MDIKQMQKELAMYARGKVGTDDPSAFEVEINRLAANCPVNVTTVLRAYYSMLDEQSTDVVLGDEDAMLAEIKKYIATYHGITEPPAKVDNMIGVMAYSSNRYSKEEYKLTTTTLKAYLRMLEEQEAEIPKWMQLRAEPDDSVNDRSFDEQDMHRYLETILCQYIDHHSTSIGDLAEACPPAIAKERTLNRQLMRAYEAMCIVIGDTSARPYDKYTDDDFMMTAEENAKLSAYFEDPSAFNDEFQRYVVQKYGNAAEMFRATELVLLAGKVPKSTIERKHLYDDGSRAYVTMMLEARMNGQSKLATIFESVTSDIRDPAVREKIRAQDPKAKQALCEWLQKRVAATEGMDEATMNRYASEFIALRYTVFDPRQIHDIVSEYAKRFPDAVLLPTTYKYPESVKAYYISLAMQDGMIEEVYYGH